MFQEMLPNNSSGGGNANINVLDCYFYNVNGNSYITYNGTTYNASGSPLVIEVPNVIRCTYTTSNTWKFTNLSNNFMYSFATNEKRITTDTAIKTPDSGSLEHYEIWSVEQLD